MQQHTGVRCCASPRNEGAENVDARDIFPQTRFALLPGMTAECAVTKLISTSYRDITVCTTLVIGFVVVVGSFISLAKASSYSGSVWKVLFALICTTL